MGMGLTSLREGPSRQPRGKGEKVESRATNQSKENGTWAFSQQEFRTSPTEDKVRQILDELALDAPGRIIRQNLLKAGNANGHPLGYKKRPQREPYMASPIIDGLYPV